MILKEITYSTFKLPLSKNFITAKDTYNIRTGFILKIKDELGNTALGEATPLENFSNDTFNFAAKSLAELKSNFINTNLIDAIDLLSNFSSELKLSPTVRFAFDQCLINLLLKRNKNPLSKIFHNRKSVIPVNFVAGFESETKILAEIKMAIDAGFQTFKFKVGRDNIASDLHLISEIRNSFGDLINIRLDANGKWDKKEAEQYIPMFEEYNIQFIEQPVSGTANLLELAEEIKIRIAPDECIKSIEDVKVFLECESIDFIVLKPSQLGSMFNTLSLIEKADKLNKNIIISSALETAIGRSAVAFIASFVKHNFAHGLDTAKFFGTEEENDFYPIENGSIDMIEYPPEFL